MWNEIPYKYRGFHLTNPLEYFISQIPPKWPFLVYKKIYSKISFLVTNCPPNLKLCGEIYKRISLPGGAAGYKIALCTWEVNFDNKIYFFPPNFICPQIFFTPKNFLPPHFFSPKIFFYPQIFFLTSKIILPPKFFFAPKIFFAPNFFWPQNFLTKKILDSNFFFEQNLKND